VGGGAKSTIWRQICADVFGCPVVCPVNKEAGAMGAALQAVWCAERAQIGDITDAFIQLDETTRTEPDVSAVKAYDEVYANYLSLNNAMAAF